MPQSRRGVIRYLVSLVFGLAGGVLGVGLSMLVMVQVAVETVKAGTDKTGMGGSYALWLLTVPLQFLAGAAVGVMCVDGLYKLRSPTKENESENMDKSEDQEPVSPRHAESYENEIPSDFWPIQWYRKWNKFYAHLISDLNNPGQPSTRTKHDPSPPDSKSHQTPENQ